MLRLENISYHVPAENGKREAILDDVSLTIPDGKYIVITGPNGGGKTTLAKVIMGLVEADAGRIYLNDTDITEYTVTERANAGISYGFQQPPRFKGLTVKDLLNIAAGRKLKTAEACDYLTKVGLCAADYLT